MKNKKTLIIVAVIVAIAIILTITQLVMSSRGSIKEVDITKVVNMDLLQSITVTGNIEANNKEDITLSNMQKVTDVLAIEGQQIKAGEVIARIDTDYKYQLDKAQMSYDVTKLNLEMAKGNLSNLVNVKSASSKKNIENAVQQAQINLDTIKSSLAEAKNRLDQNQVLFNSGIISSQEYDASVKTVADLENQVKLAEIQLENAKINLSDYSVDNKSQVDQQRNQVQQLTKQLESAKADIDNIASKLDTAEIKSSIDGKIVKLDIKPNQYPNQENNIVTIYDLSKYKVNVSVSQYDAIQISNGQRAVITVKGLDKDYDGTVTNIGEAAEITYTGTNKEAKVEIEVVLSNPDDQIKVGYEADIEIILMETKEALAVNLEAIQKDKNGAAYVYVVENNRAVKRIVKTGTETEFDIQILEGLKVDEAYIKNPPAALKEGDRVKAAGGK
ncbi:MAG: HlyD family efflux transporter periplasmic adaptor subunit [Clostridia bacterium]|jgi:RND family efflux transporter MFP subunit|nr:HlyD family efflux transporter periplasmic adaptor subunit [Clostridia bacterium]